eukprot:Gregarina_sp_Poly_1__218@NODE_1050_length_5233_cov_176_655052_g730_i0_p1_GENE_NODE_1050_length_5233_cov_176_655052_g730_i0NODE_1050_length_5233_cov_176_655052_g730_i0_p1_ORF_typecomplete_len1227_score214_89PI3_PI4_kinase/PF00454_27/1_4e41PI3Ka/PF00613_20/5_5e10PI3Ka/PF00613_20/2_1e03Ribosom_S30AE_C/PF16321_5/26Ribosom_S30AE_C/PF16321_5/48TF_Zn_Ribbon/PF08271_12/43TF_Zn_Ribbon/PF08271_12/14_NODE_1050_length_5233_cov_176_655052_g730_i0593739
MLPTERPPPSRLTSPPEITHETTNQPAPVEAATQAAAEDEDRGTSSVKKGGGGLLRLFQSECFDSYFHMFYLFKREEQGIHDYLVNLLYRRPDEEIHFYLPQLCQLSIVRAKTSALPRFLLDKAAKSMHLALKSNWFFQAALEDKLPELSEAANKMREEIEMAGVNSKPFTTRDNSSDLASQSHKLANSMNAVKTPDLFLRRRAVKYLSKSKKGPPSSALQRALQIIQEKYPLQPAEHPSDVPTTGATADQSQDGDSTRDRQSPPASPQTSPAVSPVPAVVQPEPMDAPIPSPVHPSPIAAVTVPTLEERQPAATSPLPPTAPGVEVSPTVDKGSRSRRLSRKGRIAPGFVSNTGSVSLSGSKVKLTSVYLKLGPPFNYSSFSRESHSVLLDDSELQQYIIKQRRCEYFNLVGQFITMIIEVSDKLIAEPERSLRVPLLINFLKCLDEWMLCRRCIVAASEGIFAMTGLLIPFTHFGVEPERATLGVPTPFRPPFLVHPTPSPQPIQTSQFSSVQMLRVVFEACKVFSSKKRAPYLLVFELADLDEDLQGLLSDDGAQMPRSARPPESKGEPTMDSSGSKSARETDDSNPAPRKDITWDSLHVFSAIIQDLKNRQLFAPAFCSRPLTSYELERIEDPRNREVSCSYCYPPPDTIPPTILPCDFSTSFPFECPNCKGTKVFYEAIQADHKLMALRRSLGVPKIQLRDGDASGPQGTGSSATRVPVVPPFDPTCVGLPPQSTGPTEGTETETQSPAALGTVSTPVLKTTTSDTGVSSKSKNGRRSSIFSTLGLATGSSTRSRSAGRREDSAPPMDPPPFRGRQPLSKRSSSVGPNPNVRASSVTAPISAKTEPALLSAPTQTRGTSTGPGTQQALKKVPAAGLPSIANMFGAAANVLVKPAFKQSPSQSTPAKCSPSAPSQTEISHPGTPLVPETNATAGGHPPLLKEGETTHEQSLRVRQIVWGELWDEMKDRIRQKSPYGNLKSWKLGAVIVKGGDDLRQELLASQLVLQFKAIFDEAKLPLYLRPYEILVTGAHSGIMEFITDTQSIDAIKKKFNVDSIGKVFDAAFADNPFEAKRNFIESHAAYSLIGYFLQVRDRHNGNLLLDAAGHIIHIDYGYMLANSPGSMGFETSPFKLSAELLAIMDGENSQHFEHFKELIVKGFLETRKHADRILLVVEMMLSASKMPCFAGNPEAARVALNERFMLGISDKEVSSQLSRKCAAFSA